MHKIKRIITISISVWLVLSLSIILIPTNTQAATILPIASLSLDQSYQEADVSPEGTGMVEFTGTVSCELNDATSAVVELEATDTWDSATITPTSMQFSRDSPEDKVFKVSVKAPLGTSRNEVGIITVTGTVVMYPSGLYGTVQPNEGVQGRIDIAPYYAFSLQCNQSTIDAEVGADVLYELLIKNEGNIRDTFSISVTNEDELNNDEIHVYLSKPIMDIEEGAVGNISIEVTSPTNDFLIGMLYKIEVEVTSVIGMQESFLLPKTETLSLNILRRTPKPSEGPVNGSMSESEESYRPFLPGFELIWIIACVLIFIFVNKRRLGKK